MIERHNKLPNPSIKHIFRNVELSLEQLAKLCGVSRRQLSYWTSNGLVPTPDKDPLSTIERAALIKVRLEQGDNLRQAVQKVADYYEQYRDNLLRLEGMSNEERGKQLARDLEELHTQVNRLQQVLSGPSPPPFPLHRLMTVLRNMALNELLALLPHSQPTPELIIRLQQSVSHLRLLLAAQGSGHSRELPGA